MRNRYVLLADLPAIGCAAILAFALRFDWLFFRARPEFLPFLIAAQRVILCAVGTSAHADLDGALAMLRRHAVPVEPLVLDEADSRAGETLLDQCTTRGADLLVMGAYGHTRLREFIFGGATRQALQTAYLPVLFSA